MARTTEQCHSPDAHTTCEKVNRFLVEYLEGVLTARTQEEFEAHVNRCPACLSYFEQYRKTIELVHTDRDLPVPEQLVEHTLEFLRGRLQRS